jgi:hypothetical protein
MDYANKLSGCDIRLVFVASILEVHCNRRALQSFYNFKYGRPPTWPNSLVTQSSIVQADFCIVREIMGRRDRPKATQDHLSFLEAGVVYFQRPLLGGLCAELLLDYREVLHPRLIANEVYDIWSNLRVAKSYFPPEMVLSDILVVTLLKAGFVSLHCAALKKGHLGILIWARANTGKTTTAWRLVSEIGCQFLGDDIAISDGNKVYACPYTATGVPPAIRQLDEPFSERLKSLFFLNAGVRERLVDHLDTTSLATHMTPTHFFLLTRGDDRATTPIAKKDARDLLLRLNRLEFRYHFSNSILLNLWNNTGWPDIQWCANQEALLIEKLVDRAESIFQVIAPDPYDFATQIRQLMGV